MREVPWDEEAAHPRLGRLDISYYEPNVGANGVAAEPVQSHLKLTMIDRSIVVLGSGNMDRASWYTSQELGVAFYSTEMAVEISRLLSTALEGRTRLIYDRGDPLGPS